MTELSPAAQTVLDAYRNPHIYKNTYALAAALRAAADQVVPADFSQSIGDMDWDLATEAKNDSIRDELLSIADQLEAH